MNLYLLRHAIAAQRDDTHYPDDSQRPLTSKGRRKMRRIAAGLRVQKIKLDLLLSSPYLRARQTAEIVADVFRARRHLHFTETLAPEGDPRALIRLLKKEHRDAQNIMLVGHEPYLSLFVGTLLTGSTPLPLLLKKGGLCGLSANSLRYGACATLHCLLTPRQLVRLAG
jgi:phosphohistidine phosphatase